MVLEAIFKPAVFLWVIPSVLLMTYRITKCHKCHKSSWDTTHCTVQILPSPGFSFLALEFGNNPKGNREVWEPSFKYASWLAPFPVFLASPGTHNQCYSCNPYEVAYRPSQHLTFQNKNKIKNWADCFENYAFSFNSQSLAALQCWLMKLHVTAPSSPTPAMWGVINQVQ